MKQAPSSVRARSGGFTLIELMVAITIAMVVTAGLCAILMNMKSTFMAQDKLGQLQDSQRLALSMMTTTVQSAGYFVDPVNYTAATALPVRTVTNSDGTTTSYAAGQAVTGTTSSSGSDTLSVRYQSAGSAISDGLLDCKGSPNSNTDPTAPLDMANTFAVNAQSELTCSVNGGAPVSLISNVSQMKVVYGVDTDGDGSVDRYLTATQVTSGSYWPQVITAKVTITFVNVLSATVANSQTTLPPWVQTISLMGRV